MAISINGTTGISGVDGSASTPALQGSDTNTGISFGTDEVAINTGGTERAKVDASGRLLVGTSSARSNFYNSSFSAGLQLEGIGTGRRLSVTGADEGGALILARQTSGAVGGNTIVANGDGVGYISFQGNDGSEFVEAANIVAQVDGTPGANDMPGRLVFSTTSDGAASPAERARIENSGRILINTTTNYGNTTQVEVRFSGGGDVFGLGLDAATLNTGTQWMQFTSAGGTERGSIDWSGSAVRYNTSSDYRLKENVIALSSASERLLQLKPSRFNFIEYPEQTIDGFIAHEVQEVVPEAVSGEKDAVDADGNPIYQGIDQSKLVPLLTAALQEAITRIEALEAEVQALKGGN